MRNYEEKIRRRFGLFEFLHFQNSFSVGVMGLSSEKKGYFVEKINMISDKINRSSLEKIKTLLRILVKKNLQIEMILKPKALLKELHTFNEIKIINLQTSMILLEIRVWLS